MEQLYGGRFPHPAVTLRDPPSTSSCCASLPRHQVGRLLCRSWLYSPGSDPFRDPLFSAESHCWREPGSIQDQGGGLVFTCLLLVLFFSLASLLYLSPTLFAFVTICLPLFHLSLTCLPVCDKKEKWEISWETSRRQVKNLETSLQHAKNKVRDEGETSGTQMVTRVK